MLPPQRVCVLLGGNSAEREISLLTGRAVAEGLIAGGHLVTLLDPSEAPLSQLLTMRCDLVFLGLHGTFGEDGQIQRQLDALNIPYTGSGALASELAFHKQAAKLRFQSAGLPTPTGVMIASDSCRKTLAAQGRRIGYPLVVKPEAQGSSLGVSIVRREQDLFPAIELAAQFDERLLLEQAISGEDWTVPVLDGTPLPPIRITTSQPFFTYDAKYQSEETKYEVVADAGNPLHRTTQELAIAACESLNCCGLCRVDLIVDRAGKSWILEVNTLPGLTTHSLVPKSAGSLGWSMTRLTEEILSSALQSSKERLSRAS